MLGMVLFILFMIVAIMTFVLIVLEVRKTIKGNVAYVDYNRLTKKALLYGGIGTAAFTAALGFIYLWMGVSPKFWEVLFTVICGSLFYSNVFAFYVTFRTHYYLKNPELIDKRLYRVMMITIPVMILSLFYVFNGFANYMHYPIPNGISFTEGFTYPNTGHSGLTIAFYAICILAGAVFVYFLSDHRMYQQYGKHGTIESTFFVAFPAGILGARIWYVIGNWYVDGYNENPIRIFYIWEGGLTILGGAIMGIVVGVLWFMWRNKKLSIWVAVDMIVPTILLAQAIGRLGNFFNIEVHGNPVPISSWSWLPMIIYKNGVYSSSYSHALTDGTFYLPLFLIEGVINVAGYFVISSLFGKLLRKYTELGDLAFGYVAWYGLTRLLLEPLRDVNYNMGSGGYWSWIFSGIFLFAGSLMILGNHIVRYLIRKHKNTPKTTQNTAKSSLITTIIVAAVALVVTVLGAVLMVVSKPDISFLAYNNFNFGIIFLIIGLSIMLYAVCALIYHLEVRKQNEVVNEQI